MLVIMLGLVCLAAALIRLPVHKIDVYLPILSALTILRLASEAA